MSNKLSIEDQNERDKGLQLIPVLEKLAQTNDSFQKWLQIGFDQAEAGQVFSLIEGDAWVESDTWE